MSVRDQDGGGIEGHGAHFLQIHQKYIHIWNGRTNSWNAVNSKSVQSGLQERSPCNWVRPKKKKKRNQDRTCFPGRELWRGSSPSSWTLELLQQLEIGSGTDRGFRAKEECGSQTATGRDAKRPTPEESPCAGCFIALGLYDALQCVGTEGRGQGGKDGGGGWVLKLQFQRTDLGERTGVGCWKQPE